MAENLVAAEFGRALNRLHPGWTATADCILGPDHAAVVRIGQRHRSQSPGHVDVQFLLERNDGDPVELWDCLVGYGSSPRERAQFAAHLWANTTAGAWLELAYSLRGQFADHYRGDDAGGFPGWHAVGGAILGFGGGDTASQLQQWWLNNPVLPAVAEALRGAIPDRHPVGLKIFFGGDDVAEVRVNGEPSERASRALAALPWPRLEPAGFVRSYLVLLHTE